MLRVAIITGSTRPGRRAPAIAEWVAAVAEGWGDASFAVLDIAEYRLPLLDEPRAAVFGRYSQPHTLRWSKEVASFDAYVFITPEYNRSTSAALKNAIDFLFHEWGHKPAGLVGYGVLGGIRAIEHLRHVLAEVHVVSVRSEVSLTLSEDFDGRTFAPRPRQEANLHRLLAEVVQWGSLLKGFRAEQMP